jgi:anti-anti-sigma factor
VDIDGKTENGLATVRVRGFLDTKSSPDFEKSVFGLLQGGARAFVIDFSKLDMLTSSGIRILMTLMRRLGGPDRLALWGLNEQVKTVFLIAGLNTVFKVFDTEAAALELVKPPAADAAQAASKVTRLVSRLMGEANAAPARRPADKTSKVTEHVSDLLKQRKPS